MGDPLTAPKWPKTCPKQPDFTASTSNLISMQSYHSKNNYAITMLSRAALTVSWQTISPIYDHGGPHTAPKQPTTCPKQPDFPLSTSNVISMPLYHSKNDYAITIISTYHNCL